MDLKESYYSLLAEYAAGSLDEAQALAVAAHMSLSENARRMVLHYESIGGTMLAGHCTPVPMREDSFARLMSRIESAQDDTQKHANIFKACRDTQDLPNCLYAYVEAAGIDGIKAQHKRKPLFAKRLTLRCRKSDARLISVAPSSGFELVTSAPHILIVLEGSLNTDGNALTRGDLIVLDEHSSMSLRAPSTGALCLVARPRGSVFQDIFVRWIRPLGG